MGLSVYPPVGGGQTLKTLKYTTTGSSTFTLPSGYGSGNPLSCEVTILAGGGAAGGAWWTNTGNYSVGGGGGAGGIIKTQLSLTSDMTVFVGRGGVTYDGIIPGGNGQYSYIGNGTPKNLFINPQMLGGGNSNIDAGHSSIAPPFSATALTAYSFTNSVAIRGGVLRAAGNWGDISVFDSQNYHVKPSTNYAFSIYIYSSGSNTLSLSINWYTETGSFISTTSSASNFTAISSWSRAEVGGASPSNAAYALLRIHYQSGGSGQAFSNAQFEEGSTTATTYVDGDSAGYTWGGVKTGSVTYSTSDIMYIANGGGGGAGIPSNSFSSGNFNLFSGGYSGGCSGGGQAMTDAATKHLISGDGGGLGGSATWGTIIPIGATPASGAPYRASRTQLLQRYADFNFGTMGGTWNFDDGSLVRKGAPGPANNDGLGRGGSGSFSTNSRNNGDEIQSAFGTTEKDGLRKLVNGRDNYGDGGSFLRVNNGGTIGYISGKGGSGLVIIKYWS